MNKMIGMLTHIDFVMLTVLGALTLSSSCWVHSAYNGKDTVESQHSAPPPMAERKNNKRVEKIPDFAAITDVRRKKKAFFGYMLPIIEDQNRELSMRRQRVQQLQKKSQLAASDKKWLASIGGRYDVERKNGFDSVFFTKLLEKVDIIPVSLALVQSANESAWGTSRFAKEANNFFGQWCYDKGCGLVPSRRPAGKTYEVQKFSTVSESLSAYMHNLNVHPRYEHLRVLRASKRKNDEPVIGSDLAKGLEAYSSRGGKYIDELISMIASNGLVDYDFKQKSS